MERVMTNSKIQVTLSDGDSLLKNWEETYETDLSATIDTVKQVQQSINDYLTQLVNEGKSETSKVSSALSNLVVDYDDEDDLEVAGVESDIVTGFIKNMGIGGGSSKRSKKQKNNYSENAKKLKK